jgi:UPF0176 protein
MKWQVTGFYRFAPISNPAGLVAMMTEEARALNLRGTLLVAEEGVNGTVAAQNRDCIEAFLHKLVENGELQALTRNDSETEVIPFHRLKVKLKKEIIAFRQPCANPNAGVGHHVEPHEWNDLIADKDVVLLDTRNTYEVEAGTFRGAFNPNIETFGQFAEFADQHLEAWQGKKVAMFCTGGIRCEKASAYLLAKGIPTVYQLHGGILRYIDQVEAEESLFSGTCYVFDERTTVG